MHQSGLRTCLLGSLNLLLSSKKTEDMALPLTSVFGIFRGLDKLLLPKAPELSRISRCRFKNLVDPQTPEVEGPRVTYDSSEAVPAFQSSLRVQIRKVETSIMKVLNGADANCWGSRNVANALGTPASLPTPPDRFWGDPADTRHTFDNFSDL